MNGGGESVSFKIPFLPPSFNSLYGVDSRFGRVKVFLKSEGRQFKEKAKMFMPSSKIKFEKLRLEIGLFGKWFCKNKKPKRKDLQNLEKILIDAIAEKYGFDDSLIFEKLTVKEESGSEAIKVTLVNYENTNI